MRHEISEEQARRDSRKSARPRNTRNSWQHFEHLRTAMARTGRYAEEAPHKAGVGGANHPRVQRRIIRMRVIMTAANFSPAVASRRATYNDDFRVPTLLGAQELDHTARASPTRYEKYRHGSRT
jgi:alkylation response protein AidB-like acyl-CoA dehydrogenase